MFITVIIAIIFLFLFFVNVKKGQYDDMESPAVRMLFDDELVKPKKEQEKVKSEETSKDKNDSSTVN